MARMGKLRAAVERLIKTVSTCDEPAKVVEALEMVGLKHPQRIHLHGLRHIPSYPFTPEREKIGQNNFPGPDIDGVGYWSAYRKLAVENGRNAIADYSRTASAPFTLTDGMHYLQLRGNARWPFDLHARFKVRDGLYCPLRRWLVFFSSSQLLRVEAGDRHLLLMAAEVAAGQLERIVKATRRTDPVALSPRERLILRERAHGRTMAGTAAHLGLSIDTVRTYTKRILKKLDARNITHAVHIAWQLGQLDEE